MANGILLRLPFNVARLYPPTFRANLTREDMEAINNSLVVNLNTVRGGPRFCRFTILFVLLLAHSAVLSM